MDPKPQEPAFEFDAFISYSRKDIEFARALETALEKYTPPKGLDVPHRHLRVFRDEEDFTGVEYNQALREHLENSAKMLVICSPHARASTYVCEEIRLFAEKQGAENIVPILLWGIPNNEARQPAQEAQKAFPDCLRELLGDMPLAANFLEIDPSRDKPYKGVFKGPWYTVLANIYGVSRSAIEQRDRKRKTRRRWIRASLVAAVILILSGAFLNAVSQRNRADRARNDAEELVDFMVIDLRDSLSPIGRLDLLDAVNQKVNDYYQAMTSTNSSPDILRRQGVALNNQGDVLLLQGRSEEALAAFQAARDIRERLLGQDPTNTDWARDLSISHDRIGEILVSKRRLDEALTEFTAGKTIAENLSSFDPQNPLLARDLSISHDKVGDALVAMDRLDEALAEFLAAKAIAENLSLLDLKNTQWARTLSISHDKVGDILVSKGRKDDGLAEYQASLAIRKRLLAQDPTNAEWVRDLFVSHFKVGRVLFSQERNDEALAEFLAGRATAEALSGFDPKNTQWSRDLSLIHAEIGNVLMSQGRFDEALGAYRVSKEIREDLRKLDPESVIWARDLSTILEREAGALSMLGRYEDALTPIGRTVETHLNIIQMVGKTAPRNELARALGYQSWYLLFAGQPDAAVDSALKGIDTDPSAIWLRTNLAHGHLLCGRYAEAEKIYLEHCDVVLQDGTRFDQAVLDDFQELRRNGIEHPDMERIERLLASRQ
jgi:tetratricopeptide (TPR) repeat protein